MYQDLEQNFWWNGMKKDIAKYVQSYLTCQQVKVEHQRPDGELQLIQIPKQKWDNLTIYFIMSLPKTTNEYDAIWVIVDRFTKSTHFLLVKKMSTLEQLAEVHIKEVILNGVPKFIIIDCDTRFTLYFWKCMQEALRMKLKYSTVFHPQTDRQTEDRQTEWTNQILEDML